MEENVLLTEVMRSLGAAWRSLRLYPPTSPMTFEAVQRVCAAVEEYVQAEPSLKLDVMRGGFMLRGIDDILTAPGAADFADALGSHGVGELHFLAPPEPEEMLSLIGAAQAQPGELHERGGMQTVLTREEVTAVRVVPIVLQKIETPPEIPEEEADKFLAELAADAGRLAVWLRSLLASDDEGLTEGLLILADAAPDVQSFGRTMSASFLELDTGDKDRLLETAVDLQGVRHIMEEMLANLTSIELAAAVRGGRFGENLSALSYALTALPVEDRRDELVAETVAALRAADTTDAQITFLEQMVHLRRSGQTEPPLAQAHTEYVTLKDAGILGEEHVTAARRRIESRARLDGAAVETLFQLLDLTDSLDSCGRMLDAVARAVPHLLEAGETSLAMETADRMSRWLMFADKPWPELDGRFAQAAQEATGMRSMIALLELSATDERAVDYAKDLLALGGEPAAQSLASAVVESESENSMEFGEAALGRRLPELLAPEAAGVEALHAAKLAELLAREGSPRCIQALGDLIARPEDQVRARTARGIGRGGGQALASFMPRLLRDDSLTVALVAVSALAENRGSGTIEMLAGRLGELESESELPLAREIIGVLTVSPSPAAESALKATVGRGGFLRKGKDSEIKQLARNALNARAKGGAG